MIAIVDYNMGNLASVKNAFLKLGKNISLESDPDKLSKYNKIILPGVGAYGDAMFHLKANGMDEAIKSFAKSGKPLLGICLGMQLLFDSSTEFGNYQGLGLVKGKIVKFDKYKFSHPLKIPHMGWNRIFTTKHQLFNGLDKTHYLYFVHSFHAVCDNDFDIIGQSEYGYKFTSAIAHDNIMGIQSHPEKSHINGLKILENFIKI